MKISHLIVVSALALSIGCSEDTSETQPEGNSGVEAQDSTSGTEADVAVEDDSSESVTDSTSVDGEVLDIVEEDAVSTPDNDSTEVDATTTDAEEVADTAEPETADTSTPQEEDVVTPEPDVAVEDTDTPEPSGAPDEAGVYGVETATNSLNVTPLGTIEVVSFTPDSDGPWPLMVFAPGFQLAANNFNWVGEHLASHGYAVLIPTFGDSFLAPIDHVDLALAMRSLLDIAIEEEGPFGGQVDSFSMAAGGHSRGGKVSILAAIQDARIQAVFTLDPVDAVGGPFSTPTPENPSVTPELMDQLDVPSGYVGAGQGAEGFQPCAPQEDNYNAYYTAASSPAYQWVLPNAGHNDFATDLDFLLGTLCPSNDTPETAQNFGRGSMIAFLAKHVLGSDAFAGWLDGTELPAGIDFSSK